MVDDITPVTGWEAGKGLLPNYHPIYHDFRGLVFLESDDPSKLPLNTSKNGLNTESIIYNKVLKLMVRTARPVVNYLSKKYDEQKKKTDSIEEIMRIRNERVGKISLEALPNISRNFVAPVKKKKTTTNISYQKSIEMVNKVKRHMGVNTNTQVGSLSFDYYVKLKEIK